VGDGDHDQDDEAPGLGAVAYGMIDPTASRTTDQPGGLPVTTSFTLTIDCADADQMMKFWTTALGYKSKDPPEGFDDWCSYFAASGCRRGSCTGTAPPTWWTRRASRRRPSSKGCPREMFLR
jgi:hypothetical protein